MCADRPLVLLLLLVLVVLVPLRPHTHTDTGHNQSTPNPPPNNKETQVRTGEQVKKPLGGCDKHPCLCTRHPFIEIFLDPTTKLDEQSCFSSAGSAKSLRGMTRPIQLLLLHKCLSIGQCYIHLQRHFW